MSIYDDIVKEMRRDDDNTYIGKTIEDSHNALFFVHRLLLVHIIECSHFTRTLFTYGEQKF